MRQSLTSGLGGDERQAMCQRQRPIVCLRVGMAVCTKETGDGYIILRHIIASA